MQLLSIDPYVIYDPSKAFSTDFINVRKIIGNLNVHLSIVLQK